MWAVQTQRQKRDDPQSRNRERSLFGLTDKRAPTPLKCALGNLLCHTGCCGILGDCGRQVLGVPSQPLSASASAKAAATCQGLLRCSLCARLAHAVPTHVQNPSRPVSQRSAQFGRLQSRSRGSAMSKFLESQTVLWEALGLTAPRLPGCVKKARQRCMCWVPRHSTA